MARLVPETIPSRASEGEKRMFAILGKLPEDYVVYYEPSIRSRHPDFIVIGPDLGFVVIEVKGWYLKSIAAANVNEVTVEKAGRQQIQAHPLRQARDYLFALLDLLKEHPRAEPLLHEEGNQVGRPKFPLARFAVLSNITREALEAASEQYLEIFPPRQIVCRDELLQWEEAHPISLTRLLASFFERRWPVEPMSQRTVDLIRSMIHPEIVIPGRSPGSGDPPECPDIKILDLKQEEEARQIGSGHRVVSGVPGSGKTVMLIARAKYHLTEYPEHRVLVLCYNVCLATYLRSCLADFPNARVLHFHGLAKEFGMIPFDQNLSDEEFGQLLLNRIRAQGESAPAYDAVLIDEARDYEPSWFKCTVQLMHDPETGDLLIVGDRGQGVMNRARNFTWSSVGVNVVGGGRSKHLEWNYRNTKQIVELAERVATSGDISDERQLAALRVSPEKTIRKGLPPIISQERDREAEGQFVLETVAALLRGEWGSQQLDLPLHPSEIGILYRRLFDRERSIVEQLVNGIQALPGSPKAKWIRRDAQSDTRSAIADDGVKIQTIHSSKGLQYRAVIVLFADMLGRFDASEDATLLYVALTRPEDFLVISYSQTSPYLRSLLTSETS